MRKAQKVLFSVLQYDKHHGLWYLRQYDTFLFRSVSVLQTILTALLLQAMAKAPKEEVGNFVCPLLCISVEGVEWAYCFLTANLVILIVKALEWKVSGLASRSSIPLLRKVDCTEDYPVLPRCFASTCSVFYRDERRFLSHCQTVSAWISIPVIFVTVPPIVSDELFKSRGIQNFIVKSFSLPC